VSKFSDTLSTALEKSGVSLRQVSRDLGINISALSKMASGTIAPSVTALRKLCGHLHPDFYYALTRDYGPDLLIAYLRDCADESGLDTRNLQISLSDTDTLQRFAQFPPAHVERAYTLTELAQHDADFDAVLESLEPVALRHLAKLADTQQEALRTNTAPPKQATAPHRLD